MKIKLNLIYFIYELWQKLEETFEKEKVWREICLPNLKLDAKLQLSQYGIGSKVEKQIN